MKYQIFRTENRVFVEYTTLDVVTLYCIGVYTTLYFNIATYICVHSLPKMMHAARWLHHVVLMCRSAVAHVHYCVNFQALLKEANATKSNRAHTMFCVGLELPKRWGVLTSLGIQR